MRIDLNCDMGESFGHWRMGHDEGMMKHISSASAPTSVSPVVLRPITLTQVMPPSRQHAITSMSALAPYLDEFWRDQVVERGITQLDGQSWPINAPKTHVATNQRDGQMTYHVDGVEAGENPHVNYEPSARRGLVTAPPAGKPHTPFVSGHVTRQTIGRELNFQQAGER